MMNRAFAVNVKTIALGKYLYQSGHAIRCERTGAILAAKKICRQYSLMRPAAIRKSAALRHAAGAAEKQNSLLLSIITPSYLIDGPAWADL